MIILGSLRETVFGNLLVFHLQYISSFQLKKNTFEIASNSETGLL